MRRRSWSVWAVVAGLVLTLVPAMSAMAGPPLDLAQMGLDALGEMGTSAPAAVTVAVDDGYTGDQLADGITAGNLTKNGTIVADGQVVTPAGEPAGIIAGGGEDGEVPLAKINKSLKRATTELAADLELRKRDAASMLAILVFLAALNGYDAEQIIFDGVLTNPPFSGFDWGGVPLTFRGMQDADGKRITPASTASARAAGAGAGLDAAIAELDASGATDDTGAVGAPATAPGTYVGTWVVTGGTCDLEGVTATVAGSAITFVDAEEDGEGEAYSTAVDDSGKFVYEVGDKGAGYIRIKGRVTEDRLIAKGISQFPGDAPCKFTLSG